MKQTIQYGTNRARTASFLVTEDSANLYRIDGFVTGAANAITFLQLHDRTTVPTANLVPRLSRQVLGNNGFSYIFERKDEAEFVNGIYLVLSTDERNYVADAANTVSGDLDIEDRGVIQGATAVGDYTTGIYNLAVRTEAQGPAQLQKVVLKDIGNFSGTRYLMLFAKNTANLANGARPIMQWACAVGATVSLTFGAAGRTVTSEDADSTFRKGITLWLSDTTGTLTDTQAGSGEAAAIKAWYK